VVVTSRPLKEVNSMLKLVAAAHGRVMNAWDLRNRQEGQTMAEYGVVLAVLTIATVAIFTALSGGITNAVQRVINLLGTAGSGSS
jgi:Flp pilus assembly pilin Flp